MSNFEVWCWCSFVNFFPDFKNFYLFRGQTNYFRIAINIVLLNFGLKTPTFTRVNCWAHDEVGDAKKLNLATCMSNPTMHFYSAFLRYHPILLSLLDFRLTSSPSPSVNIDTVRHELFYFSLEFLCDFK